MIQLLTKLVDAATGANSDLLTPIRRIALTTLVLFIGARWIIDQDVRHWFYIGSGIAYPLVHYYLYHRLLFGWPKKGEATHSDNTSDRNGLRTESHVEKSWKHEEERWRHEERMLEMQMGIYTRKEEYQ